MSAVWGTLVVLAVIGVAYAVVMISFALREVRQMQDSDV